MCPYCGSNDVCFYERGGYYWCQDCKSHWDYDEDSPDYDEAEIPTEVLSDDINDFNIY